MDVERESQLASRCRFDWGRDGARRAADRRDVVVIVDTLRFSTAAVTAVSRGATVRIEGGDVSSPHRNPIDTLSPVSYETLAPGAHVTLRSPNGAACCRAAQDAPYLFVAALVNARAAAHAVAGLLAGSDVAMTVIACGERRHSPGADGLLRFAIEDYLGAGAILSYLGLPKSSEAAVCAAAFESVRDHLSALLLDSTGGVELRHKGREEDVLYAARLDILDTVPVLRRDELHAFSASMG